MPSPNPLKYKCADCESKPLVPCVDENGAFLTECHRSRASRAAVGTMLSPPRRR